MIRSTILLAVLLAAAGCGPSTPPARTDSMVPVTGTATLPGGKPAANLTLVLLPSGSGTLQAQFNTDKEGKFKGEAFAGEYTYFFEGKADSAVYKALPPAYKGASADHKVTVKAGDTLSIKAE
jgi:hypothetical protein